jgi:hypothetical protein
LQSSDHAYCRNANEISLNNISGEKTVSEGRLKENASKRGEIPKKQICLKEYTTENVAGQGSVINKKLESVIKAHKTQTQLAIQETICDDMEKERDLNLAFISNSIPDISSENQEEKQSERTAKGSNNFFTEAVFSWKKIPSQICRLCACTNDLHPKQSIVGWLSVLNEILPGVVSIFIVK